MTFDEMGLPLLVEGVPATTQGSCGRNQVREGGAVRRESILSIGQSARRSGSALVVVGRGNLRILCEVCPHSPSGLRWFADGVEVAASRVSHLLNVAQGDQ